MIRIICLFITNRNMAREIEIKIALVDSEIKKLKSWLKKNASFEKEIYQKEFYLNNPKNTFYYTHKKGFKDSEHYLRVRFENENLGSVCLKIFAIDQILDTAENIDEIEFQTNKPDESLKLLEKLGYTDKLLLEKKREVYVYKDFEIVLDDVTNLGHFAEFELKSDDGKSNIKDEWNKIRKLIKGIGFKRIKEQHRGYISMLWNPDYEFGVEKVL